MTKLAIFDLDGTLLNTIADLGAACNHALAESGYPLHTADEYPHLVGNGVNRLIERALPEGKKSQENILKLRQSFIPYYNRHNKVHTKPYDGIEDTLQTLKTEGWLLAVASNKYQAATEDLINHYFPGIFDAVFGEREGCPRKPDPQIVSDIISSLNITPNSSYIIYIGDSDVDMQTAKNAGLKSVACSWGFCSKELLQQYQPDYIINEPYQLTKLIKTNRI
ncbi:MAG: HAD family hydrolase [Paludibacteraceae bacterium]|nr:HAD family hydrolase [Paludibacteraceae bacterium]